MEVSRRTDSNPENGARPDHRGAAAATVDWTPISWRGTLLIVLFWTLYGTVIASNLLVMISRERASAASLLGFAFGGAFVWAALSIPLFGVAHIVHSRRAGWITAVQHLLLIGAVVAAAVSISLAGAFYFGNEGLRSMGFDVMVFYRFPLDLLAGFLVLTAGVARQYFLDLQARLRETIVLRSQLVESRLESLRSQLNPHFLFNTLNAVSALAPTDPPRVQRILAQLSELLRYMLEGSAEEEIPLEAELRTLRRYLEILEIRYEGWLKTSVQADPDVMNALVPNLILQPLAENALKHGVGRAGGRGRIDVRGRREGDDIVLTIRDTGPGGRESPARPRRDGREGGFGLRQTRERLEQLYGDEYDFRLTPAGDGGTIAEIRLPYHTREHTGRFDALFAEVRSGA